MVMSEKYEDELLKQSFRAIDDDEVSDRVVSDYEKLVVCAASSYEEKYYFNPEFSSLPETIQKELQVMCVLFTADVGGILTLQFDEEGNLLFHVASKKDDFFFDEIGSNLKIREIQREKVELLKSLELYYRVFFLGEDINEE